MKTTLHRVLTLALCFCLLFGAVACTDNPPQKEGGTPTGTTTITSGDDRHPAATTSTTDSTTKVTTTKGPSPAETFGVLTDELMVHPFYTGESSKLAGMLPGVSFINENVPLKKIPGAAVLYKRMVFSPNNSWRFTHETAVAEYKGVLYCAWFNNYEHELSGYTPIRGSYSTNGGKTWSTPQVWAEDPAKEVQYAPPMFGEADGHLYLLTGLMRGPDNMIAMELYKLDESSKTFKLCRKFNNLGLKLHNNIMKLPNGKLIVAARTGEVGHNCTTPAVWISDSGKIDTPNWRVVKADTAKTLPDGSANVFPETALMLVGKTLYMFMRNQANEVPLVYISKDYGETWSDLAATDVPFRASKLQAGTLSDGRGYLIANVDKPARQRLVLYLAEKGSAQFTKELVLFDNEKPAFADNALAAHYPNAWQDGGKLYVVATVNFDDPQTTEEDWEYRGAGFWALDISKF